MYWGQKKLLINNMETAALVAPVTALEFLQDAFLLTGEGPVLKAYSLHPRPKVCTSLTVLQHSRIHGIRPRDQAAVPAQSSAAGVHEKDKNELSPIAQANFHDLAVFGGKVVRLVRLHVSLQGGDHLQLEMLGHLMELQDWILDVRWLSGGKHLCVALAHNSALLLDIFTGSALVQRSCLEGCLLYSALLLVQESWVDTVLVGGTVFNQLVLWRPGGGKDHNNKAPVETRLQGHSGVIFKISYLQEKGWLASASDDRSIRVWVVGALGGSGGKCGDLEPACLMVLYGHQARVFSVCLSPGKVYSAGEDGSCLVWDWTGGGKVVRTLKGHRAGGIRALAVSKGTSDEERWVATGGADGGVRLWRIKESEESKMEEVMTEKLTDLQFPGQGMPKAVRIAAEGKAGWSQSNLVVCTDLGIVYQYSDGQWGQVWQGSPEFQSYCVMETISIIPSESTAKLHLCAVGNLSGSIFVFPISQPKSGILLTGGSGKIHNLIWQNVGESVCLLASGSEGLVYRWFIEIHLNEERFLDLSVKPLPSFLLPPCAKRWLTAVICLLSESQEVLWVCGDRRGSLLLFQEGGKILQKRGDDREADESLVTYKRGTSDRDRLDVTEQQRENEEKLKLLPLSCLFGVHGKQGVTSLCEYQGLLYSTGRDGCVRVFWVRPKPPENLEGNRINCTGKTVESKAPLQLEVLRVQRACKGMEWLERILILKPETPEEEEKEEEGVEFSEECENHYETKRNLTEKAEKREIEARFVIVGFHAVHFVVWDPVRQERLLAVPCGGGHRSWGLWPSLKGVWPGYGALVFIKQGSVLVSLPPGEEPNWPGKAGMTGGWGLREGVHGRGIGCVCRLGRIEGTGNAAQTSGEVINNEAREVEREKNHWEIVVTGGEDTSLTVLAIHPNSGNIKVLSVITDHISSVRTVTAVTRPEAGTEKHPQSLSALLLSAGGRAQMQCYRLLISWDGQREAPSCQVIQVAAHRLDEQWERRRNRHKMVKMDPETRYMSAVVVDEETDGLLLALACSDGAVRLFSISEVKHQIFLLWESYFHQRCVLSVDTCSLDDAKGNRCKLLFSAATDGRIAVWNLTEASSSADASSDAPAPPIPCLSISAHQSGVNSLAVWAKKLGQQEGGCLVTVASGGDDGQLAVSVIRVMFPEDGKTSEPSVPLQTQLQPPKQLQLRVHTQSRIPLAHAAPLTALKLLRQGLIVSTSSDQRVCLWKVGSKGIEHKGALCSHVADAAGLAVWEGQVTQGKEGDEEAKTRSDRLESKPENAVWTVNLYQAELEMDGKTSRRLKDKDTADETEPVETETGDTVCKSHDEKSGKENQAEAEVVSEREVNTCESRIKAETAGWVLVCGQGFQLLRLRNSLDKSEKKS